MSEAIDVDKLASVMNRTGEQGKADFVKMLWNNQPADVQVQLMPLLNAEARQVVERASDNSEPPPESA
ncbi:hypothetical protein IQ268_20985 [Oculatella sp. LEGE 06141]|uniref:hypothetical protein n=1 Tax=Oculatella sp. LEGE 06141 TaxID=1828648 RepID=UPI0018812470|nr:hypothetical protein [Oculatella sp. LEGE 06141]MBE9181038.1 hypothetical protein [Oculatella sp. LEGE 06141]